MPEDAELIEELGIAHLTPQERQNVIDELNMQVGEALADKLSNEQLEEYQQIIDGNQEVITTWLDTHIPEYKETEAYKEIEKGVADDPEHVPADKIFAYLAWVDVNNPDLEETVAKIKAHIKLGIDSYK